jgi:hypothetical protein
VSNQLVRLPVKRNKTVKVLSVYPMENTRVECLPSEIDAHFTLLAQALQRLPASLPCNLDDMGWAEYQDIPSRSQLLFQFIVQTNSRPQWTTRGDA